MRFTYSQSQSGKNVDYPVMGERDPDYCGNSPGVLLPRPEPELSGR